MTQPSSCVEDYLKSLFHCEQDGEAAPVSTSQIARRLDLTPGSVTTMLKNLARHELVEYVPYRGARLTPEGKEIALAVVRRHRLIELFLVEVLGMGWSEVHDEAERLEHAVSDRLVARIAELLGNPQADPHGDPIPSASGDIEQGDLADLWRCPLRRPRRVVRILDQRRGFLESVSQWGLRPGTSLRVIDRNVVGEIVSLQTEAGSLDLGVAAAQQVLTEAAPSS